MSLRFVVPACLAGAILACFLGVPAFTQDDGPAAGDSGRGRQLAYTCYGCHGIANYKNVYPTYSVPKLQGQHPEYLATALEAYRNGERAHATMHAQAASLSEQDMKDVAVFLAGNDPVQPAPAAAQADSAAPAIVTQACLTCHGADGVGLTPLYPTLSGQHADYLARALHDYKNGTRKNAIMAGFAAQLSDEDIRQAAEYYAKRRPGLSTAEHAIWFAAE